MQLPPDAVIQTLNSGLRLKQLQIFVAVAETLSFSRAANMLYVSQSLVSQQVAELEQQVGTPLLLRDRRSVQLTLAGEVMLKESKSILQRASSAMQMLKNAGPGDFTLEQMHIGFEQVYQRTAITQAATKFQMEYPGISFKFSYSSLQQLLSSIDDGTVDLGFLLLPEKPLPTAFQTQALATDVLCIVAARTIATAQTLEHYLGLAECLPTCLLDRDTRGLSTTLRVCHDLSISPNFQFYDSVGEILLYVEAGCGVSILPSKVVQDYASSQLSYFYLTDLENTVVQMAACWSQKRMPPLVPTFLEFYQT